MRSIKVSCIYDILIENDSLPIILFLKWILSKLKPIILCIVFGIFVCIVELVSAGAKLNLVRT